MEIWSLISYCPIELRHYMSTTLSLRARPINTHSLCTIVTEHETSTQEDFDPREVCVVK